MAPGAKVVVVGGGPVGSLSALYAARRGYEVELYELRDDPNYGDPNARPDIAVIPLALSERGVKAIAGANVPGLIDEIIANSKPTYTRMVHLRDPRGNHKELRMNYGPQGQCLHTMQREKITKHIMLALGKQPNVKLFFNHRMTACDFEGRVLSFEQVNWKDGSRTSEQRLADSVGGKPTGGDKDGCGDRASKRVRFDFLIGADGTYSSIRQGLMRTIEVDFSQTHINALWCDLEIPAAEDGSYRMDPKCLHIWPANESIIVAQPDFHGAFRAGMVCDTQKLRYYEANPQEFGGFFAKEFPGIIPDVLSAEEVTRQFLVHQKIPLKSVKCNKFGYKDSTVLLGDSAHTMTPFHAMGMITGLEDVRIFFEKFHDPAFAHRSQEADHNGITKERPFCPPGTVQAYTDFRLPDVTAMVDLASDHYYELRFGVRSRLARAKQFVDAALSRWMPQLGWTTKYARVQFGNERFTVVLREEERQRRILGMVLVAGSLCAAGAVLAGLVTLRAKLSYLLP